MALGGWIRACLVRRVDLGAGLPQPPLPFVPGPLLEAEALLRLNFRAGYKKKGAPCPTPAGSSSWLDPGPVGHRERKQTA